MKPITAEKHALLLGVLISAAFGVLAWGMTVRDVPYLSVISTILYPAFVIIFLISILFGRVSEERRFLFAGVVMGAAFGLFAWGLTVPSIALISAIIYLVLMVGFLIYLFFVPIEKRSRID